MEELLSKFRRISLGEVQENKQLGSDVIEVVLKEITPAQTGEIKSNPKELEAKGVDASGEHYTSKTVTNGGVHNCVWLPHGSNRLTAPDVRRGEEVEIYQFADDTSVYYWTPSGMTDHLRRLETVVYGFNANPNYDTSDTPTNGKIEQRVPPKYTDYYTFEVSTHTKQITMRTVQLNGEKTTYIVQFNTAEGSFNLVDAEGNVISLDSLEAIFTIRNSFGSELVIDKNEIRAYAADLFELKTKLIKLVCKTLDISASDLVKIGTKLFNLDCPDNTITGNLKVGTISTGVNDNHGGMHSIGNMSIKGNLTVTGTFTCGHITCDGIDSSSAVNAPNID